MFVYHNAPIESLLDVRVS